MSHRTICTHSGPIAKKNIAFNRFADTFGLTCCGRMEQWSWQWPIDAGDGNLLHAENKTETSMSVTVLSRAVDDLGFIEDLSCTNGELL